MTHLLLVDDQPDVLHALSRLCRDPRQAPLFDDLKVTIFQGPCGALEFARHNRVDIIVAGHRMVEMSGARLLEQFRAVQPHAARIIMSVRADRNELARAVREGEISGFVVRPWNDADIKHSLFEALEASRNASSYQRGPETVWGGDAVVPHKVAKSQRMRAIEASASAEPYASPLVATGATARGVLALVARRVAA